MSSGQHRHTWHLVEYKPQEAVETGKVIVLANAYAKFLCEGCGDTKIVREMKDDK